MSDAHVMITVTTDKSTYAPGEPISLALDVTNQDDTVITFEFASGQRHDFEITSEAGKLLWRWSADKGFIQVLGEEQLAPGDTLTYQERFEGPLSSGTYAVVGALVSTNFPLLARAAITVR